MKNLQIFLLVFCVNSLFAQQLVLPNSNFTTASIRPCPFDTTQSFLQADDWLIYQTLNDKWDGVADSTKCIGVTSMEVLGVEKLVIKLDQVDISKPVFVKSLMDDSTKVLMKSDWIYSAQAGMETSENAFANFSPNCANGFCSGVFFGIEVPDSTGTGTNIRMYSDGIASGTILRMNVCLATESFQENYLREVIFKFKLLGTQGASLWFRPQYTQFYEAGYWQLQLLERDTFVSESQYNSNDSSYNISIFDIIPYDPNFFGGDVLLVYQDSTYPSPENISYLELSPEVNDTFPKKINLFNDFFGTLILQPFTAIRGGLIEGSDSIRHQVNLFNAADFCLEGGFIELIFGNENHFVYQDGHVNFGGENSCFRFQEGSKLIVDEGAYFHYGNNGEGLLALATGGSIELRKNSTLYINTRVFLYELEKLYGKVEDQQIFMELNEGSSLIFGEYASLSNKYSIDKKMKLNIYMNGGVLDISNLSEEDRKVLNLIYPTPTPHFKDNVKIFPNPTEGEFNISLVLEKEETIELRGFDMTGKVLFSQKREGVKGVNKIPMTWNGVTQGIYFLKVKTSLGEVVDRVAVF